MDQAKPLTIFNLPEEGIRRTVYTNYLLIAFEGVFGYILAIKYHVWSVQTVVTVVLSILVANVIVHILIKKKASVIIMDIAFFGLSVVVVVGLTALVHYLPEIRSALLLAFIPTIIFSATMSLPYGISNAILFMLAMVILTILETYSLYPYVNSTFDFRTMDNVWKAGTIFSFFFLLILAFLANYFMEVLRRREKQIKEINAELKVLVGNIEEEKDKTEAILYGIGDGVFAVDKDLKITMFNQGASAISGYSAEEAIGKRYDQVLKFSNEKSGESELKFVEETVSRGQISKMPNYTVLDRKDHEKIPVADSSAPLKDQNGSVIGCVVVFSDVTKERAVDKAKSEFVSLASHQLKTPLSTINWYIEMILDGDAGKLNKEQEEFVLEVYKSNQRMVGLVNALLNVSRIELGTLSVEPKPTNLADLAKDVVDELEPRINQKKQHLTTSYEENLPKVNIDPKLMRIVFQNLLSNAVKYTPDKGKINLSLSKDKSGLLLKVRDTGYGITKNQQSRIFTKLFRADNIKERETDGTGLGLYIVKSVIDECGGRVWFESVENKGTTFYITIPLAGMSKKSGLKKLEPMKP